MQHFNSAQFQYRQYNRKILSSQKLVRNCGKAIKKAVIFSQTLESSKSSEVHSTERNLPLEVKLSCNLVKESLNFSNLVFSNLCSSYLWRICLSSRTTGKQT
jgi:hypothetical protein